MSGVRGSVVFALFHIWTHFSHKGVYRPCPFRVPGCSGHHAQNAKATLPICSEVPGCDTTVSSGLWVPIPSSVNIPAVLTEVSILREVGNRGSDPGSATLSLTWPWTSDLTFSVPSLVQLNRSHQTSLPIFRGRQIHRDQMRSWM